MSLHLRALGRGVQRDPASILNAAERLDALLFAGFDRSWDRVVVCPVGTGYNLPWGLLPTLRDIRFVLTPSIAAYLRCQRIEPVESKRVVAVAGPRLDLAEDEAHQVIEAHGGGDVLTGSDADADHVRQAISGAEMAPLGRLAYWTACSMAWSFWPAS